MARKYKKTRVKQWIKTQWLHGREWIECHYCGNRMTFCEITLDHVQPISKDGSSHISNLIPACACCNRKRGDMPYADFVRAIAA